MKTRSCSTFLLTAGLFAGAIALAGCSSSAPATAQRQFTPQPAAPIRLVAGDVYGVAAFRLDSPRASESRLSGADTIHSLTP